MTHDVSLDLADFPLLAHARDQWNRGPSDESLIAFDRALNERPNNVRALLETARAYGHQHLVSQAEEIVQRADSLHGNQPNVAVEIAMTYARIFRPHRALQMLERLYREDRLSPPMIGELARLYDQTHQLDRAASVIVDCIQRVGRRAEPVLLKARIDRRRGEYGAAETSLRQLTQRHGEHPLVVVQAWAELCQILDRAGDFDGAVHAIEQAKRIQRTIPRVKQLQQRSEQLNLAFSEVYDALDSRTLRDWLDSTIDRSWCPKEVMHLIGFPRSGTTLIEQSLDRHPELIDSPEREVFSRNVFSPLLQGKALTMDTLNAATPQQLSALRSVYFERIAAVQGESLEGRVLLDKNPNHTALLAGILRVLPESRFLFALRDPRDVIVSCYLRYFPLTEFSSNYVDLPKLCLLYASEMKIWSRIRDLIPDRFKEVRYEESIADIDAQATQIFRFLNMDPGLMQSQPKLLDTKIINSPSYDSVQKPIYTHAIGRWRNYETHFGEHFDRLAPLIVDLGYA